MRQRNRSTAGFEEVYNEFANRQHHYGCPVPDYDTFVREFIQVRVEDTNNLRASGVRTDAYEFAYTPINEDDRERMLALMSMRFRGSPAATVTISPTVSPRAYRSSSTVVYQSQQHISPAPIHRYPSPSPVMVPPMTTMSGLLDTPLSSPAATFVSAPTVYETTSYNVMDTSGLSTGSNLLYSAPPPPSVLVGPTTISPQRTLSPGAAIAPRTLSPTRQSYQTPIVVTDDPSVMYYSGAPLMASPAPQNMAMLGTTLSGGGGEYRPTAHQFNTTLGLQLPDTSTQFTEQLKKQNEALSQRLHQNAVHLQHQQEENSQLQRKIGQLGTHHNNDGENGKMLQQLNSSYAKMQDQLRMVTSELHRMKSSQRSDTDSVQHNTILDSDSEDPVGRTRKSSDLSVSSSVSSHAKASQELHLLSTKWDDEKRALKHKVTELQRQLKEEKASNEAKIQNVQESMNAQLRHAIKETQKYKELAEEKIQMELTLKTEQSKLEMALEDSEHESSMLNQQVLALQETLNVRVQVGGMDHSTNLDDSLDSTNQEDSPPHASRNPHIEQRESRRIQELEDALVHKQQDVISLHARCEDLAIQLKNRDLGVSPPLPPSVTSESARIQELEERIQELEVLLGEKSEIIQSLQPRLNDLESPEDIQAIEQSLNKQLDRAEKERHEMEQTQAKIKSLETSLKEQIDETKEQLQRKEKENHTLHQEVAQLEASLAAHRSPSVATSDASQQHLSVATTPSQQQQQDSASAIRVEESDTTEDGSSTDDTTQRETQQETPPNNDDNTTVEAVPPGGVSSTNSSASATPTPSDTNEQGKPHKTPISF